MDPKKVSTNEVVNYVSSQILSGPGDPIWDDIFDWIQNAIQTIIEGVSAWFWGIWSNLKEQLKKLGETISAPFVAALDWVKSHVGAVWDWVFDTYHLIADWVRTAWDKIYSAASSAISIAQEWIASNARATWNWITQEVGKVATWITAGITNLSSAISAWLKEQWSNITGWFSTLGSNIGDWFSALGSNLATFFTDLWLKIQAGWDWLTEWITEHVVNPLDEWWDKFLEKVFNFGAWVGDLLNAVVAWLEADVPGSSPRWEGFLDKLWNWFFGHGLKWGEWPAEYFWSDMRHGIETILTPLNEMFKDVFNSFMEAIEGFAKHLGPMSPDTVMANYSSIATVGLTALGGLAAMTVAGEFLNPLSHLGLGHVSAMIYDMTNYKLITGAAIGALTFAMIKTPLTYYYNRLFRPHLLEARDFMELMARRAFTEPEALQNPELITSVQALTGGDGETYEQLVLSYYGYRDEYYGFFRELANTPLRYFPLAGIARTGFFEKTWFTEALHRSGYSKTARDALMVMYEKMRDEALQGAMSGAAVTRFKEGFTTEEQFHSEMALLGYSDEQFEKYLAAALMDYATDYLRDLLSAYREALRKGHIDMDQYRTTLLGLGIVPERVEAYVLMERARLKPDEELTPISVPKPTYETEAGKVQVDTIRRQRRKILITRDQEIDSLLGLGMEVGYATAVADNDDVRLAEKGGEE